MSSARAWCRVDLAGGTLDIWPLGLLHPNARTINLAIDLPVEVELRARPEGYVVEQGDKRIEVASVSELLATPETALIGVVAEAMAWPPLEVQLSSGSPRGGGLGASSAIMVAAGERLLGLPGSENPRLAALARDLEVKLMHLPTGVQDHFPALMGGALEISYPPGGVEVRRLDVDLKQLGKHLLVVYTGQSHFSAGKNWQVIRRRLDGETAARVQFDGIAASAEELAEALRAGDFEEVGRAMLREWSFRQQLAPGISTAAIEKGLTLALDLGAWGGKACGAGGGGSVALLLPEAQKEKISAALTEAGFEILPALPTAEPLLVA